jgi:hypothetical protein
MIDEALIQYIWKYQKLASPTLRSIDGETLQILSPGIHNHDAGPDFLQARIRMDGMEWCGPIEIHVRASDWHLHKHDEDQAYQNVILHVVWVNDAQILRKDGSKIPTVDISRCIHPDLIEKYKGYIKQPVDIPCEAYLSGIPQWVWHANLDRMAAKRLEIKAMQIHEKFGSSEMQWEETAYRQLGNAMGFSLNAEAFDRLTRSVPFSVLRRISDEPKKVFALLLGMSGHLELPRDDYQHQLNEEFLYLKKLYQLDAGLHMSHWKKGRMRPANLPVRRIAQFAQIMAQYPHLFSHFMEVDDAQGIFSDFQWQESYWQEHFDFGKTFSRGTRGLSLDTRRHIALNAVIPIRAAYAQATGAQDLMEKAIYLLEKLPAEKNRYTRKWTERGMIPSSALDSQAMITLYKDYCSRKKCLNCGVGRYIFDL